MKTLFSTHAFLAPLMALSVAGTLMCNAAEQLDRGAVALRGSDGKVYVGWRLLRSDPPGIRFDILRLDSPLASGQKVNREAIGDSCNYVDSPPAGRQFFYQVVPSGAEEIKASRPVRLAEDNFLRIKFQGSYRAQMCGIADLDGDGALEFVVKQPDFNTDPYQKPGYWKKSETTYKLEAYRLDGTMLWRYDMGWAIEEGIWYSPVLIYDVDGDGKAEVYAKAGEGDPRGADGRVMSGPEYLVKLDGQSGKLLRKIDWPNRDGFDDYNYYCRNFLAVAYLDGRSPHLVVQRGTYKIIKTQAFDAALRPVWQWEASGPYESWRGQGAHGLPIADIDADGCDEVIIGSAALDHDGKPLWNNRLGHPDACYVADIDPAHPGLEIFYGIEPRRASNTVCVADARTGKVLWGYDRPTTHVHGQGMLGDIDPSHPGMECYAGEQNRSKHWLYSANGQLLSDQSLGELAPKALFWADGPTKLYVSKSRIYRYPSEQVGSIEGRIVAIADCLGDWREEILTSIPGELRIYSSTIPAGTRRNCLLQDRQYRTAVAAQTMGYFYPPQLGGNVVPD